MLNMKMLFNIFALSFGIFSNSVSADECGRAGKWHSSDVCTAVSGCQWCESIGIFPVNARCVTESDALVLTKSFYTCSSPQNKVQSSRVDDDDDCDDDDNDLCDLHKRDQAGCMTNPMCTWCVSSGLVPATPECVLITDAPWIPKQIYTCASKVQSSIQTSFQRTQFEPIIWENAFQKIIKSQPTLKTTETVQVSSVDDDDDDDDCDDDDSINRYTSCVSLAIKQGLDISVCDSLKNAI
jgi:hypothetical protein